MKRRATTGGKVGKTRRRSTHGRRPSYADLQKQLSEALEQQTATSEVLQIISSSPGELGAVFESLLDNAIRICAAQFGNLFLYRDGAFIAVAMQNAPAAFVRSRTEGPNRPAPESALGRVERTKQIVQIADLKTEPHYKAGDPFAVSGVELGGIRTLVSVPMLKDGELIGAINIYRQEVRPFTEKQIALVQNFATQAVIAIENTRLLNELRQRTNDLTESLEQQTATSEVLKVISSSPGELELVFEAMLENATRICGAKFGTLYLREGDGFRIVAMHGAPPAFVEERRRNPIIRPGPGTILGRATAMKQTTQIVDIQEEADHVSASGSTGAQLAKLAGARSTVAVPMIREDELIGAILIFRQEVQPFTDKQIELLTNFAAQAVIAIENARLLSELRQRTDDLTESLEQQTATSEVLSVISSSAGELEPVFRTMLENAVRICEAKFGNLFLYDLDSFRIVAQQNPPPAYAERWRGEPVFRIADGPRNPLARLAKTKIVVDIADLRLEPGYIERDPRFVSLVESAGARTHLLVPMLKDGDLIGAIAIYRQDVEPFTEKQVELVKNFAAQAVIAIENTRLLNELRQRTDDLSEFLEQQTATSEVLSVISSSPGRLEPVFQAMLANAVRICEARFGNLALYDGREMRMAAMHNAPEAFAELRRRDPIMPRGSVMARILETKKRIHIADLTAEEPFASSVLVKVAGARTAIGVPMLRENELVGAIVIYRTEVGNFSDKQMELLTNFAAQAVIAIENTRLLGELRESLQQQTATADVLKVISRSTFDLQTVLDTLVEFGGAAHPFEARHPDRTGWALSSLADYGFTPAHRERMRREAFSRIVNRSSDELCMEGKAIHFWMHKLIRMWC